MSLEKNQCPPQLVGKLLIKGVYWNLVDNLKNPLYHDLEIGNREDKNRFAFDFLSIHYSSFSGFSIHSPLHLVDQKTGKRPLFEEVKYKTRKEAVIIALELAKLYKVFVVDCTICDFQDPSFVYISHKFTLGRQGM